MAFVYLIMKLLYWDRFPAGMAPLLIGMCFLGSVQIFFIGMVGEYVLSINQRVMKRPLVVEEERLNFGAGPGKRAQNGSSGEKNSGKKKNSGKNHRPKLEASLNLWANENGNNEKPGGAAEESRVQVNAAEVKTPVEKAETGGDSHRPRRRRRKKKPKAPGEEGISQTERGSITDEV